jgi:hypothetical protein
MSNLKLNAISPVKTEKEGSARSDGKVNRQYYVATFSNPANPFGKTVSRTFWQQHSADGTTAEWKGADPVQVRPFLGKLIPGNIVAKTVEDYPIIGLGGEERYATSYTAVVLDGETVESVFKASGKIIVNETVSAAITTNEPALAFETTKS